MSSTPSIKPVDTATILARDEIDIGQVVYSLIRQKKLIAGVAIIAFAISSLYAITRKNIWEGQFQIVLESEDSVQANRLTQIAASNQVLASIAGISGDNSNLKTEIKILESPSVLKATYEFVKSTKAKAGLNVSNWTFTGWKESLDVQLEKGTTILNIAYRDTDPSIILPVINKISKTIKLIQVETANEALPKQWHIWKSKLLECKRNLNVLCEKHRHLH